MTVRFEGDSDSGSYLFHL